MNSDALTTKQVAAATVDDVLGWLDSSADGISAAEAAIRLARGPAARIAGREGELPQTVSLAFTSYAGMDIGRDNGLVVDRDYEDKAPYAFTGTVEEVDFDLMPVPVNVEQALHEHASVQAVGQARLVSGCRPAARGSGRR